MKSFELESFTTVKITDVVVLSQKNRDPADNPGAQLQFLAKLSNNELTQFDGSLKSMLYTKSAASSAAQQGELDGVEAVTDAPNLTSIGLAIGKFHWSADLTGYELVIDHGMGGKSNITLENCTQSNFKIDCKEGGTIDLSWMVEAEDVTEGKFGKLATLKNREVKITLSAPEVDQEKSVKTEFALLAVHDGPTITAAKVAEMLGITERTLENKIYNKSCPVKMFKLGSQYVAHVTDVAKYIDDQREGVAA